MFKKAVQQGRSKRKAEAYCCPYVEALSAATTQLEAFFNILLGELPTLIATRSNRMDAVVSAFAQELREQFAHRVREIRLFGSRARGDAREGSDYDLLVVVDKRTPEVRRTILEIETGLMDRYGALVTTALRSEDEWRRSQAFPLARNIAREGVLV